jgi:hypothetical protein
MVVMIHDEEHNRFYHERNYSFLLLILDSLHYGLDFKHLTIIPNYELDQYA